MPRMESQSSVPSANSDEELLGRPSESMTGGRPSTNMDSRRPRMRATVAKGGAVNVAGGHDQTAWRPYPASAAEAAEAAYYGRKRAVDYDGPNGPLPAVGGYVSLPVIRFAIMLRGALSFLLGFLVLFRAPGSNPLTAEYVVQVLLCLPLETAVERILGPEGSSRLLCIFRPLPETPLDAGTFNHHKKIWLGKSCWNFFFTHPWVAPSLFLDDYHRECFTACLAIELAIGYGLKNGLAESCPTLSWANS